MPEHRDAFRALRAVGSNNADWKNTHIRDAMPHSADFRPFTADVYMLWWTSIPLTLLTLCWQPFSIFLSMLLITSLPACFLQQKLIVFICIYTIGPLISLYLLQTGQRSTKGICIISFYKQEREESRLRDNTSFYRQQIISTSLRIHTMISVITMRSGSSQQCLQDALFFH